MGRCIQLARSGAGMVAPNPLVGCVIVNANRIIGEGYHERFGGPHAEVMALQHVSTDEDLQQATLYVNLEPCNHYGKTPPCTDAILRSGIKRVVVGMTDPNHQVNGLGIQKLRDAGIDVITGVLEKECQELNIRFVHAQLHQQPYVILKWAQSSDGFIGKADHPVRISNETTRFISHAWRAEEQAILVGARTVMTDNPKLNTRYCSGRSPVRILLDRSGALAGMDHLHVFDGTQRTIVFGPEGSAGYRNAEHIRLPDAGNTIDYVLESLWKEGFSSVLVEGGAITHELFLKNNSWNECRIFMADKELGSGIIAPFLPAGEIHFESIDGDRYVRIVNNNTL
ncbi:MAG: 5-amino-6-(5-phosphoribosylamino)uracil reductase [Bacteroidota bacterium]